jgi:DNA-binding response OmpR family regulator
VGSAPRIAARSRAAQQRDNAVAVDRREPGSYGREHGRARGGTIGVAPSDGGTTPLVLVADDEPAVRDVLARELREDGFAVVEAATGAAALRALHERAPDLVVLDVVMPDRDGLTVLRELRRTSAVPVILLSGRSAEMDRVLGLEFGADDYVTKPFSAREVVLRARAVLRRATAPGDDDAAGPDGTQGGRRDVVLGALRIDPDSREVSVGGKPVALTAREFDLLLYLATAPRAAYTRRQILADVWHSESPWQDPDTVTEHVRRIRRKIGPDADVIDTVRGVGYRFKPPDRP